MHATVRHIQSDIRYFQQVGKWQLGMRFNVLQDPRGRRTSSKCFSTSTPTHAVYQHLPTTERKLNGDSRTLVLLYSWLLAKSKHLEKFARIYNGLGADVITIKPNVMEVLRPMKAEKIATKVLDTIQSSNLNNKTIIVHGFSVGGYIYAQTVNKMITEAKYAAIKDRIVGQIFDSPVDFDNIPKGISTAATENVVLRKAMQYSILSYLSLTRKHTVDRFLERSELFYNNPVRTPALFLFSKDDPVAVPEKCERCVDIWRDDLGMDVVSMKWDSSPHVSHFYRHKEEYSSLLIDFFKKVNNEK